MLWKLCDIYAPSQYIPWIFDWGPTVDSKCHICMLIIRIKARSCQGKVSLVSGLAVPCHDRSSIPFQVHKSKQNVNLKSNAMYLLDMLKWWQMFIMIQKYWRSKQMSKIAYCCSLEGLLFCHKWYGDVVAGSHTFNPHKHITTNDIKYHPNGIGSMGFLIRTRNWRLLKIFSWRLFNVGHMCLLVFW